MNTGQLQMSSVSSRSSSSEYRSSHQRRIRSIVASSTGFGGMRQARQTGSRPRLRASLTFRADNSNEEAQEPQTTHRGASTLNADRIPYRLVQERTFTRMSWADASLAAPVLGHARGP